MEIKELTHVIVNEFIKKIIVHAPEKMAGKRVQKADIVFNFVGEINFLSKYTTETAKHIGTRKDGTVREIGAIPPNLKLLSSNRKHFN